MESPFCGIFRPARLPVRALAQVFPEIGNHLEMAGTATGAQPCRCASCVPHSPADE